MTVAVRPQAFTSRLVGGDRGVADTGHRVDRARERVDRRVHGSRPAAALEQQHDGPPPRERQRQSGVLAHQVDAVGEHHFERHQRVELALGDAAGGERGREVLEREQRDHPLREPRHQLQVDAGDHRQRAFAPGEHARPRVSGVVLAQRRDVAEHGAVGPDGFEPDDLVQHRPVP